jgi:2-haloacid dehalogenase
MLVESHKDDLAAAHALGLKTAFIERPAEFGPKKANPDLERASWTTFHATDFNHLADQLGA